LEAHDRNGIETVCYASGPKDAWTARIRAAATQWRDAGPLDDGALEHQILADGIDILIDLSGHTPGNRLAVFARKPAPVQISWLGYFNTTGLAAMDYLLTDSQLAPTSEACPFVEEPLRIEGCYFAWQPPVPSAGLAPRPSRAFTTYGCFNKLAKIGLPVVETWAAILQRNQGSRLVLKNKSFESEEVRRIYRAYFEGLGIDADRIDLLGPSPYVEYLCALQEVDILLDTFPYAGGTTTCEALSMGVPVVTLRGDRFAGRLGATVLHNAGFADLIAETKEEYIEKAVALGRSRRAPELVRDRVARSALCDVPAFTRKLEAAYRNVWSRWCGQVGNQSGTPAV